LLSREETTKTENRYAYRRDEEPHQYLADSGRTITDKWMYTYEEATGFIQSIKEERHDVSPGTLSYSYDKSGNVLEIKHTFGNSGYNSREIYFYDEQGKMVKSESRGGSI